MPDIAQDHAPAGAPAFDRSASPVNRCRGCRTLAFALSALLHGTLAAGVLWFWVEPPDAEDGERPVPVTLAMFDGMGGPRLAAGDTGDEAAEAREQTAAAILESKPEPSSTTSLAPQPEPEPVAQPTLVPIPQSAVTPRSKPQPKPVAKPKPKPKPKLK